MKLWAEYDREGQVSRRFSSLADRHFPILGVGQVSRVQCSCRRRLNINKDDIIDNAIIRPKYSKPFTFNTHAKNMEYCFSMASRVHIRLLTVGSKPVLSNSKKIMYRIIDKHLVFLYLK